jgi:hypothetical protein
MTMKHLSYAAKIISNQIVAFVLVFFLVPLVLVMRIVLTIFDFVNPLCVFLLPVWMGWRCAAKSDLPDAFFERYWPALVLLVSFSILAIFATWGLSHVDASYYRNILYGIFLGIATFFTFSIAFILSSLRKKITNTKGLYTTCVVVFSVFAILFWQVNSLPYGP